MTDLTRPFFVPLSIRHRFCGVDRFGYLPPIERPEPYQEEPEGEVTEQLRGEVKYLRRQLQARKGREEPRFSYE